MMRTVRLSSEADGELEDARHEWERVDDAWEMIEWVLSRDPTKGKPITESGKHRTFVFEGSYVHRMPNIQIIYVADDVYVTIESVRFSTPTFTAGNA